MNESVGALAVYFEYISCIILYVTQRLSNNNGQYLVQLVIVVSYLVSCRLYVATYSSENLIFKNFIQIRSKRPILTKFQSYHRAIEATDALFTYSREALHRV